MITVKRLDPFVRLPERAHNSAGYDLFAREPVRIGPGETSKVRTGIAVEFPPGYVALIWDRSSLGSKGIHRFAGVIDADYRGEWVVCLHNTGDHAFFVERGDKIAQVLFQPVMAWDIVEGELSDTSRGEGGFGSTGK